MEPATESPVILVTGSTGYIGGRLAPRLVERGYRVRCLVRSAAKLRARPWARSPKVEIVTGDAGDPAALARAMEGCTAAYYLVHSMEASTPDYRSRDRTLAEAFGRAAAAAGATPAGQRPPPSPAALDAEVRDLRRQLSAAVLQAETQAVAADRLRAQLDAAGEAHAREVEALRAAAAVAAAEEEAEFLSFARPGPVPVCCRKPTRLAARAAVVRRGQN
jgi:NAD(P)-dependent dehydrogenase (short-subunit alcohol dehydrogenase family)